jgi:hypothetical protein
MGYKIGNKSNKVTEICGLALFQNWSGNVDVDSRADAAELSFSRVVSKAKNAKNFCPGAGAG